VTVERVGDMATVRADGGASLLLTVNMAPTFVSGTISGSARDAYGVTVVTTGTLTGAAAPGPASLLSGTMDGQVSHGRPLVLEQRSHLGTGSSLTSVDWRWSPYRQEKRPRHVHRTALGRRRSHRC